MTEEEADKHIRNDFLAAAAALDHGQASRMAKEIAESPSRRLELQQWLVAMGFLLHAMGLEEESSKCLEVIGYLSEISVAMRDREEE